MEEATGDWRKFYNEERHNLYSAPDIIKMMKSRIVKSTGSFNTRGRDRNARKISAGKPEVLFRNLGIDGMVISKRVFKK
jgi:hypothetical protein